MGLNTHETTHFLPSAVFVVFMVSIVVYMAWHVICTISTYNAYIYKRVCIYIYIHMRICMKTPNNISMICTLYIYSIYVL